MESRNKIPIETQSTDSLKKTGSADMKIITVEFNEKVKVDISFQKNSQIQHNCSWLYRQALKMLSEEALSKGMLLDLTNVVAFKTKSNSLMLDYWLTLPDKPLTPIPDGTVLVPYIPEIPPKDSEQSEKDASSVGLQDFDVLVRIGKGGYSRVFLARKKQSGRFFALKVISKREGDGIERVKKAVMRERKNFLKLKSEPHMLKLRYCFQTEKHYYFVMDFMPGGDLFHHICRRKFTEEEVKFYAMEILVSLDHLHSLNYIFRDLKPENLLLDIDGHITFADFGFLKKVTEKTALNYSYRGTPVYMAPEVIKKAGYNYLADFYSYGCVVFELMSGKPPFIASTKKDLFESVLNNEPTFPSHWSPEMQDFLSSLLEKKPEDRLGAANGFSDLIKHPWLKDMNVNLFKNMAQKPPLAFDPNKIYFRPKPVDSDIILDIGICRRLAFSDNNHLNNHDSPLVKHQEPLLAIRSRELLMVKEGTMEKLPIRVSEDRQLQTNYTFFQVDKKTGMTYLQVPSQENTNVGSKIVRITSSSKSRSPSPEESNWSGSEKNTSKNGSIHSSVSSNHETDFETLINEIRGFDKAPCAKIVGYQKISRVLLAQINTRSPFYRETRRGRQLKTSDKKVIKLNQS